MKLWIEEPWKVKEAFNVLDKYSDRKISLLDPQYFFIGSCFCMGKRLRREEMEGMIIVSHADSNDSSSKEMDGMTIVVDADNIGSVNFEEFQGILWLITQEIDQINEPISNTDNGEIWALKEAFNLMDRDGDVIVSIEDLKPPFSFRSQIFGCMFKSQANGDDDDVNFH